MSAVVSIDTISRISLAESFAAAEQALHLYLTDRRPAIKLEEWPGSFSTGTSLEHYHTNHVPLWIEVEQSFAGKKPLACSSSGWSGKIWPAVKGREEVSTHRKGF